MKRWRRLSSFLSVFLIFSYGVEGVGVGVGVRQEVCILKFCGGKLGS